MSARNPYTPTYPQPETNPTSKSLSFLSAIGVENENMHQLSLSDALETVGESTYWSPIENPTGLGTSQFRQNYEVQPDQLEGEIGLNAARKMLNGQINVGDSVEIVLLERIDGDDVQRYRGSFEVTDLESTSLHESELEKYLQGRPFVTEDSPSFESGPYSLTPIGVNYNSGIDDDGISENLEDWR